MLHLSSRKTVIAAIIGAGLLTAACGHKDSVPSADTHIDAADDALGTTNDQSALDATANQAALPGEEPPAPLPADGNADAAGPG